MISLIYQFGPVAIKLTAVFAVFAAVMYAANRINPAYRRYARLAVVVIVAVAVWIIFQRQESSTYFEWQQEVRLSDGSSLWIKRQTTFGNFGELAQIDRAKSLREDFEFINPKTGEVVHWGGQHDLEPLLLDFDQGMPYLATKIKPGKYYAWGCSPHPYALFKHEGSTWKRISIKSFPTRFERSNVFPYLDDPTRKSLDSGSRRMTFDFVEYKLGPPMPKEVRAIDRRIINPLFYCRGSVDESYGVGTTKRLQDRYGTNPAPDELSEKEAIELGIINSGEPK